jgi:hypothetical protein
MTTLKKCNDHWNSDENCYEVFLDGVTIGHVFSRTSTSSKIKNSPFRREIIGYKEWIPLDLNNKERGISLTRKSAIESLILINEREG